MRSNSSSARSSSGCGKWPTPALLTRMWRPPNRSYAASIIALTSAATVTSARTPSAAAPSFAAARSAPSPSRSATTTLAPSATNFLAMPSPKPEAAPVTRAIFAASRIALLRAWRPASGQQIVKGLAVLPAIGAEVPPVGRKNAAVAEMLGEEHERSVGEIHGQLRVSAHQRGDARPLRDGRLPDGQTAGRHVVHERGGEFDAEPAR